MPRLQQLFNHLLGIRQSSQQTIALSTRVFGEDFSDKRLFADLATPACWRRVAREGGYRERHQPVLHRSPDLPERHGL